MVPTSSNTAWLLNYDAGMVLDSESVGRLKRWWWKSVNGLRHQRLPFRDWAGNCTDFPRDVAEMARAHTLGDKVEAAYRRGDGFQKRQLLAEDWAKCCAEATTEPAAAGGPKAVSLRRQR